MVRRTTVGLLAAIAGCVIEVPPDAVPEPCDYVVCSSAGFCDNGRCYCDDGHDGNAYAKDGCRSSTPDSSCGSGCGVHAGCVAGACQCDDGFVAVCSSGCLALSRLCDGVDDCASGEDEDFTVCVDQSFQEWVITDSCADGKSIDFRVWSQDRDWVWPSIDEVFSTGALDEAISAPIRCITGENLCFGGQAGARSWGVGLDGTGECDDCCAVCDADTVELSPLTCS